MKRKIQAMLDSTVISIDDYGKPHSLNQNKHVKKKKKMRVTYSVKQIKWVIVTDGSAGA